MNMKLRTEIGIPVKQSRRIELHVPKFDDFSFAEALLIYEILQNETMTATTEKPKEERKNQNKIYDQIILFISCNVEHSHYHLALLSVLCTSTSFTSCF